MSTLGDALKGIKQLLLLEEQVRQIEMLNDRQNAAIADLVRDHVALDKRVVRIETLVEVATARGAPPSPPRLEG
ncbi:MAG: hypothetical protein H7241_12590 [Novosphingobium sp.]|nr:hypothetical protein [Novosphingobium sp.]